MISIINYKIIKDYGKYQVIPYDAQLISFRYSYLSESIIMQIMCFYH